MYRIIPHFYQNISRTIHVHHCHDHDFALCMGHVKSSRAKPNDRQRSWWKNTYMLSDSFYYILSVPPPCVMSVPPYIVSVPFSYTVCPPHIMSVPLINCLIPLIYCQSILAYCQSLPCILSDPSPSPYTK